MLIPIALIAVAVVLWLGAAIFVTNHIIYPPFLEGGFGNVIFESEQARAAVKLGVDPKSYCDADFKDLKITDDRGVSVDAWFVPGTLRAAMLLIPASGASRRSMLPYLKFLHGGGMPVLMIDSSDFARGRAGWGWNERGIVRSAAASLHKYYKNVGALGVSEGAVAALMAQAETRDLFKVIIADSAFTSLGAMLRRNPSLDGLNPAFLQTVIWELGWRLGRNPDDISSLWAASRIGRCSLLVIQNAKDPLSRAEDAQKLYAARTYPAPRGMFISPSQGHADAIYVDPQTYQQVVLDFLAQNLPKAAAVILPPH